MSEFVLVALSSLGVTSVSEIDGAVIGVPSGSREARVLQRTLISEGLSVETLSFGTSAEMAAALDDGTIDVAVLPRGELAALGLPAGARALDGFSSGTPEPVEFFAVTFASFEDASDFEGLKVISFGFSSAAAAVEANGGSHSTIPASEALVALQTGVIDMVLSEDRAFAQGILDSLGGDDLISVKILGDTVTEITGTGEPPPPASKDDLLLLGSSTADLDLSTGLGNDTITTGSGDDTVNGGRGNDQMRLGSGEDKGIGGNGNDVIRLGTGRDEGVGGAGKDKIFGQGQNDQLRGGKSADTLNGGSGDDTMQGNAGNDLLIGGSGSDLLVGGGGKDTLRGGADDDVLTGGAGADLFDFRKVKEGSDRVLDFDPDVDRIRIDLGPRDADSVEIGSLWGDTLIRYGKDGQNMITLVDVVVEPEDLTLILV